MGIKGLKIVAQEKKKKEKKKHTQAQIFTSASGSELLLSWNCSEAPHPCCNVATELNVSHALKKNNNTLS